MKEDEPKAEVSARGGKKKGGLRTIGRAPEWTMGITTNQKFVPHDTVGNASIILQNSPEWAGLRFDEFATEAKCFNPPEVFGMHPPKDGPLDDYLLTHISQWLTQSKWRLKLGAMATATAALVASKGKGRAFHPVREYLRALTWDGVPRVDSWLTRYAGVEAGDYASAVGAMWLIAAVARVMKPGSICKTMIILEGRQNAGKSTLLRRLCPKPEWFSDTPIEVGSNKDQYQCLRGKWIVEIPELDGFRGKDEKRIKSFISSPSDNYRKSFGKTNEDVPRQCVFAGSTNETHYLTDGTGNVRFWPVLVGDVDYEGIERDRDQIWAEAFALYMDGKQWHITDPRVEELARLETEQREEEDVWLAPVRAWTQSPIGARECAAGVSVADVMVKALEVPKKEQSRGHQTRVGHVMKKIGFRQMGGKARPRLYRLAPESGGNGEWWTDDSEDGR